MESLRLIDFHQELISTPRGGRSLGLFAMDTTPVNPLVIEANVIEALQTVFDPEIPVNIWEIGLIYGITVDPSGAVGVRMTLTSPNCPSAAELPQEVERKVKTIGGVTAATVEVVFEPPWEPSKMSEAAKLQLNML